MGEHIRSIVLLDLDAGAWKDGETPLHVTVTPPFLLSKRDIPFFADELNVALRQVEPFKVVGLDTELRGPNHDRLVRRLGGEGLYRLHHVAMDVAANYDDAINRDEADENYHPHARYIDGRGVDKGQRMRIDEVIFATEKPVWHEEKAFYLYTMEENAG